MPHSRYSLSLPDLFRQSIVARMTFVIVRDAHVLRSTLAVQWIAGTRPAMTVLGCKLSPSARSDGGVRRSREGVVGVVRLLRASPEQTPPPDDAVFFEATFAKAAVDEGGKGSFPFPPLSPQTK
jgi:hypothetical protein